MRLDELRKIAEAATPGPFPFIATFDPPTVLALLDVVEAAKEAVLLLRRANSAHPSQVDYIKRLTWESCLILIDALNDAEDRRRKVTRETG